MGLLFSLKKKVIVRTTFCRHSLIETAGMKLKYAYSIGDGRSKPTRIDLNVIEK